MSPPGIERATGPRPRGFREPSHRRGRLASEHQSRPDQKRVPGGTRRVVAPDGFAVSTRPGQRGFLFQARHVGGERQLLKIIQV
jgi:hypothetical protein